jgi:hypothetical protein
MNEHMKEPLTPEAQAGQSAPAQAGQPAPAAQPSVVPPQQQPRAPAQRLGETKAEMYARQTRNAVFAIAWIVGIVAALTLIGAIIEANAINKLDNQVNGGGSSNCLSQGGTNPNC